MSLLISSLGFVGLSVHQWAEPLIDKAAEKLFDGFGKQVLENIQTRIRAYTGVVPPNHDLEHAIRLAELTSTLMVLDIYRRQEEVNNFDIRSAAPSLFIPAARTWLHQQIGLSQSLKTENNDDLVIKIEKVLNKTLSNAESKEIQKSLSEAELEVWVGLVNGAKQRNGGDPPDDLKTLFFGREEGKIGWSITFLAFMREALKNKPRAEIAFVTTRLAGISSSLERVEKNTSEILELFSLLNPHGPILPLPQSEDQTAKTISSLRPRNLTKFPHQSALYSAVWSKSGDRFATTGTNGSVTIWMSNGLKITDRGFEVAKHEEGVVFVDFSPSGELIITASQDKTAGLWYSYNKIKKIASFSHEETVNTACFSPTDNLIVTSSWDGSIKIWDIDSGLCIRRITLPEPEWRSEAGSRVDDRCVNSAYFSSDGNYIVSSSSETSNKNAVIKIFVHMWDAKTGSKIGEVPGHGGGACCASFSRSQKLIASSGAFDCSVQIWDIESSTEVVSFRGHKDTVWNVDFSPDDSMVVSASNDSWVYVWDLRSKQIIKQLPHSGSVVTAYFSPCGSKILTACEDSNAYLWTI